MIFFVVQPNDPNFVAIKQPNPGPVGPWGRVNVRLVTWNAVYPGLATFFEAIVCTALMDPVCQGMLATMESEFAIAPLDPSFLSEPSRLSRVTALFYGVLRYWCSPQIGNPQSPTPAPLKKPTTHIRLWLPMLEEGATPDAITSLYKDLKATPLSTATRRAQVRIYDNIVEAARAVLAEVTTSPIRRLDKLFALKLTNSTRMLARQRALIGAYVHRCDESIDTAITEKKQIFTIKVCQYLAYYFGPDLCKTLNALEALKAREVMDALIAFALEDSDETALAPLPEAVRAIWRRLPPVARCSVLINDLRKLVEDPKSPTDVRAALALPKETLLGGEGPPRLWPRTYRVIRPERKTFDNVAQGVNVRFLAAWNPDEYAEYVMTYRMNLCPLWGGVSGHAANAIYHWREHLDEDSPEDMASVVAASLFVFWRLFYDIRISPTHTLTETFEATLAPRDKKVLDPEEAHNGVEIAAVPSLRGRVPKSDGPPQSIARVIPKGLDDAFEVLELCRLRDGDRQGAINPIGLVRTLARAYWEGQSFAGYDTVRQAVDLERKKLADQKYWLPQWSHDTTSHMGTSVQAYAGPEDPDMRPVRPEVSRYAVEKLGPVLLRLCTRPEGRRESRAPWAVHARTLSELKQRPRQLEARREHAETLLRRGMRELEAIEPLVGVQEGLAPALLPHLRAVERTFRVCIQWLEPNSPEGRAPTVGILPFELMTMLWAWLSVLPRLLQEAAKPSLHLSFQETLRMAAEALEQLKAELMPLLPSSARAGTRDEGGRRKPDTLVTHGPAPEVKAARAAVNRLMSSLKPLLQSLANEMRSGMGLAKQCSLPCRTAVHQALRFLEEDEALLKLATTPFHEGRTLTRLSDDAIEIKVRQLVRDLPGGLRSLVKMLRAHTRSSNVSSVNRGFLNSHATRIEALLPEVEGLKLSPHDDLPQERWDPSEILSHARKSQRPVTRKHSGTSSPSFGPPGPRVSGRPSRSTRAFTGRMDTHRYTGDEIWVLLGLYLHDRRDRVYIMEGIDAHLHQGFPLEDNLRRVRDALRDTGTECIVVPVHVGGDHWTALSLHFDLLATKPYLSPRIQYVDPQGTRGLPETLRLSLLSLFPDATLHVSDRVYQPLEDSHNCGPWTVALLEHLARNAGAPPLVTAFNIQTRRTEDGTRLRQVLDRH
ncbi:hypothetical protein [Corallococcus sp. 4LFB]|uniref:hypothetical protein n=1 Tax=Corallococcus sp. 4LFB TaxID=3383249 RepID=UPI0039770DBF